MVFRFILLFFVLVLFGCKADSKNNEIDVKEVQIENTSDDWINEGKEEAYSTVTPKEVKEKMAEAKSKEVEAKQKSEFKDSPCEAIIEKYHQAIELLSKDMKSVEGKDLYKSLRNDPVVRDCRIDNEFKSKFKELDKKYHGLKK